MILMKTVNVYQCFDLDTSKKRYYKEQHSKLSELLRSSNNLRFYLFNFPLIKSEENKAGWIIVLLNDIKSGNTGLLNAFTGVLYAGSYKSRNFLGFYPHENMDYKHHQPPFVYK